MGGSWVRDNSWLPGAMQRIMQACSGDGSSYRVLAAAPPAGFEDLGDHVMLADWVPQFAVLSHTNVKCFVTHGGANSVFEGLYHGVPFVVVPFFDDQRYIGPRLKDLGLASGCFAPHSINAEEAVEALHTALKPEFQDRAAAASSEARAMDGLEELVEAATR